MKHKPVREAHRLETATVNICGIELNPSFGAERVMDSFVVVLGRQSLVSGPPQRKASLKRKSGSLVLQGKCVFVCERHCTELTA